MKNILHGRFRWIEGLPVSPDAVDFVIDECNNDGNWDLIAGGAAGISIVLPKRSTEFTDADVQELSKSAANSIHRADIDNDRRSDFISIGSSGLTLFLGASNEKTDDQS